MCNVEQLIEAATVGVSVGDDLCHQDIVDIEHEYIVGQKCRRISLNKSEGRLASYNLCCVR